MRHLNITVCWKIMLDDNIIHSPHLERLEIFNHIAAVELFRLIGHHLKSVAGKFL